MASVRRLIRELTSASVTSIRLFAGVYAAVNAQFIGRPEALCADSARVWSVVAVNSLVIAQRVPLRERCFAHLTDVRSVACVSL